MDQKDRRKTVLDLINIIVREARQGIAEFDEVFGERA